MKEEMELYVRVPEHIIDIAKKIADHIDVKTETVLSIEVERIIDMIEMPLNQLMELFGLNVVEDEKNE